ncbi:hypothetical protein N0V95_004336 [Ascochyta clinopodiicola]|nr:hypothetical protein N0V95_004336 [Ascochyta clinopodiicola]
MTSLSEQQLAYRKRGPSAKESTDDATRRSKRVKRDVKPGDIADRTETVSTFDPSNPPRVEWTNEQRYWIKCHYQLILSALTKSACIAPEGTVSCAYFNAYFQGYVSEPTKQGMVCQPIDSKRTFAEFKQEMDRSHRRVFEQITRKSLDNTKAGAKTMFHPVITPWILETYIKIHDGKETSELAEFIEKIVTQELKPPGPTWVADGRANILHRRPLDMADRSNHTTSGYRNTRNQSKDREDWYRDYSTRNTQDDNLEISTKTDPNVRMKYQNIHADSGNALLNMAILRPVGYDGDLNALVQGGADVELPRMNAAQRKEFDEHIAAVKVGDAMRRQLFEEDKGSEV